MSLKTLRVIEQELEYLILVATKLGFNNDKWFANGVGAKAGHFGGGWGIGGWMGTLILF